MSFRIVITTTDAFIKHEPSYIVHCMFEDIAPPKSDSNALLTAEPPDPIHFEFEITERELDKARGWMGPIGIALAAVMRQAGMIKNMPDILPKIKEEVH